MAEAFPIVTEAANKIDMDKRRYPSLDQINTRVWLTELSQTLGKRATLDDIPDAELDRLGGRGASHQTGWIGLVAPLLDILGRAHRWGEDGIAGISDDKQRLCFALALWDGKDPILKERLLGLTKE